MSIAAYKRTLRNTEEPRQIERRLLSTATAQLESFREGFDDADKTARVGLLTPEMKSALWNNQQVWMALKTDLAMPGNSLPSELRAALLSLSLWVERQTKAILGGAGKVAPLVEINKNIIAGLEARPAPNATGGAT